MAMKLNRSTFVRVLIFLLLVAPLQAQQVFACGMLDTIFLDDCCCEDHNDSVDSDSGDAITYDEQCCEKSIQISFNIDANSEIDVLKSVEIRSDVDPPVEVVLATEQWVEPIRFTETSNLYTNPPNRTGSNTYLITQRLRI